MRKPSIPEVVVIAYAVYMWFTLTIDNTWFYAAIEDDPDSMYAAYLEFFGTQGNLAIVSIGVAALTTAILFINNYIVRIAINILGLIYFTILSASYIFSYPNLGLGLATIFVVMMIANVNRLIDEQQEERKKRIMCDSYDDEADEKGGE